MNSSRRKLRGKLWKRKRPKPVETFLFTITTSGKRMNKAMALTVGHPDFQSGHNGSMKESTPMKNKAIPT